mmetsp:Transcript_6042/g.19683  ORF Transcript_6042/g.19683 Transcript_6042/m.19683 type:complete len:873 (-) Transcript_6042:4985-7603(-)
MAVQNYTVLDGEVYDLRVMGSRHPGGDMALHHAGGRDLSSSWAAVHLFGSRSRLLGWLKAMRVEDEGVRAAVLACVTQEPYKPGSSSLSAAALLNSKPWCEGEPSTQDRSSKLMESSARLKKLKESPKSFDEDLTLRVWAYFKREAAANGISIGASTKATCRRWVWMTALLAAFVVSYEGWVTAKHWVACVSIPVLGQLVAFSVMHDASHNAISTSRWVNVLGSYGGSTWTSPHEWLMQHVLAHHLQPNVYGEDPDVVHVDRYRSVRRAAVPLYAIMVWLVALPLGLTTLAPLRVFRDGCYPASTTTEPEWTTVFAKRTRHLLGRVLYVLAFIIAPAANVISFKCASSAADLDVESNEMKTMSIWTCTSVSAWYKAFIWITAPQFLGSAIFMAVTQIAHLIEATYEDIATVGVSSWHEHQIRTTCNYAGDSWVHGLLTGGLNLQIEHHLFPTVNHCHLSRLRPIVKAVCRDWCVPYREVHSMADGIAEHLMLLHKLGRRNPAASIFSGKVWHRRRRVADEPEHVIMHRHHMWLLDLDDDESIPDAFPLRFDPRDHMRLFQEKFGSFASSTALANAVKAVLNGRFHGSWGDVEGGHIEILTMPRYFGFTFNPVSVYFAYNARSELVFVIFEVSNTPWHDEVLYAHRVDEAASTGSDPEVLVFRDIKRMHVSPFQPMNQTYEWRVTPPKHGVLEVAVTVSRNGVRYFEAGFCALRESQRELTFPERLRLAMRIAPQRAVVGIHMHAARLLAKGKFSCSSSHLALWLCRGRAPVYRVTLFRVSLFRAVVRSFNQLLFFSGVVTMRRTAGMVAGHCAPRKGALRLAFDHAGGPRDLGCKPLVLAKTGVWRAVFDVEIILRTSALTFSRIGDVLSQS